MLKEIHAQESREACARKAEEVAEKLESMRLGALLFQSGAVPD